MKRIIKNTKKCNCCNELSNYKVIKHIEPDYLELDKYPEWSEVYEDAGDCWYYIKEQYLNVQETGYYCNNHIN